MQKTLASGWQVFTDGANQWAKVTRTMRTRTKVQMLTSCEYEGCVASNGIPHVLYASLLT